MGTLLIANKNRTLLTKTAVKKPQINETEQTLDQLLAAAADEELHFYFLFIKISPYQDLLATIGPRKVKKLAEALLKILLDKTPEDLFVDCDNTNEFILLLPGVSKEDALSATEQIMHCFLEQAHKIAPEQFESQAGLCASLTAFPEDAENRIDLFRIARGSLIRAETTGVNKIIFAHHEEMKSISVDLPDLQSTLLHNIARREGVSPQFLMREALDDLLQKYIDS